MSTTSSLVQLLQSLRATPPRLIQSPATQPRRASVALIIRLRPPVNHSFPSQTSSSHHNDQHHSSELPSHEGVGEPSKPTLEQFTSDPKNAWIHDTETVPELMYIRRMTRPGDKWSSHIAFPGGRMEQGDGGDGMYTALRETWEETSLDLADPQYLYVGRLDDREITTSLGKRLLMILSPFVFLQITPHSPPAELQPTEVSSLHWIPLNLLVPPYQKGKNEWSEVEIDISSRLSPRNGFVRGVLRGLVGNMKFTSLLLPDEPDTLAEGYNPDFIEPDSNSGSGTLRGADGKRRLRLWGLTLGMTLDFLSHLPSSSPSPSRSASLSLSHPSSPAIHSGSLIEPRSPVTVTSSFEATFNQKQNEGIAKARSEKLMGGEVGVKVREKEMEREKVGLVGEKGVKRGLSVGVGPGMTSVFPRFSYPDVNFWIWVFGRRYRAIVRGWEASTQGRGRASDRRINWSGAALSSFYSAVRQALVVAIVIRGIATGIGLAGLGWWVWGKWNGF